MLGVVVRAQKTKSNFATLIALEVLPLILVLILIVCFCGHDIDHWWKVPETSLCNFYSFTSHEASPWIHFGGWKW